MRALRDDGRDHVGGVVEKISRAAPAFLMHGTVRVDQGAEIEATDFPRMHMGPLQVLALRPGVPEAVGDAGAVIARHAEGASGA